MKKTVSPCSNPETGGLWFLSSALYNCEYIEASPDVPIISAVFFPFAFLASMLAFKQASCHGFKKQERFLRLIMQDLCSIVEMLADLHASGSNFQLTCRSAWEDECISVPSPAFLVQQTRAAGDVTPHN